MAPCFLLQRPSKFEVVTPRIDSVLDRFRQQGKLSSETDVAGDEEPSHLQVQAYYICIGQDYVGLTTESQFGDWMPEDIQGLDIPSDRSVLTQTGTTCCFGITLSVVVHAIPTRQRYSDECRIKTRLSGRAPWNLTRNSFSPLWKSWLDYFSCPPPFYLSFFSLKDSLIVQGIKCWSDHWK